MRGIPGEFREKPVIVSAHNGRHKFRMMQEIEIMDDIDHRNIQLSRNPTVSGQKEIRLYVFDSQWDATFKKQIPKIGMPSLRVRDNWGDVITEKERIVKLSVKKEKKMMFGMRFCDSAQSLIRKLPDTLQSVLQQQTCVDGNPHNTKNFLRIYTEWDDFLSLLVRYVYSSCEAGLLPRLSLSVVAGSISLIFNCVVTVLFQRFSST